VPRIRTIKPEFWGDEKLAPMAPIDRLVFLGLISMSDDAGRLIDSVRAIDGFVFPLTDDTSADSLLRLQDMGRIERGETSSGQRVIQLVNWKKHQKIDKPNFSAALPSIGYSRRTIPQKLRAEIFARDGGKCRRCAIVTRFDKRDRYDADPDLAEIDHIRALADGGNNSPENLWLLCLGCNRKKAGEAARARNAERSATDRRNVGEASAPHTNDLRSTTNDLRSTTDDRSADPREAPSHEDGPRAALAARLSVDDRSALNELLGRVSNEAAWVAEMRASLDGMSGHVALSAMQLGEAIRDFVANGGAQTPNMRHFRSYLRRAAQGPPEGNANAPAGLNGKSSNGGDSLERARVILAIAREYNLLRWIGNDRQYAEFTAAAALDPRAGPQFVDEIKPLRLHQGIGDQPEHYAVREIARRMHSGGAP